MIVNMLTTAVHKVVADHPIGYGPLTGGGAIPRGGLLSQGLGYLTRSELCEEFFVCVCCVFMVVVQTGARGTKTDFDAKVSCLCDAYVRVGGHVCAGIWK